MRNLTSSMIKEVESDFIDKYSVSIDSRKGFGCIAEEVITKAYDDFEESLLCCMSAGVSADRFVVSPVQLYMNNGRVSASISLGMRE